MSKVTPPAPAGRVRVTAKVKVVVPGGSPSARLTSLTLSNGLDTKVGVSEKSSAARPSSEPAGSTSVQRIQKVAPLAMLSEEIVADRLVRSAAALPFLAPIAAPVSGVTKLSAATRSRRPW